MATKKTIPTTKAPAPQIKEYGLPRFSVTDSDGDYINDIHGESIEECREKLQACVEENEIIPGTVFYIHKLVEKLETESSFKVEEIE